MFQIFGTLFLETPSMAVSAYMCLNVAPEKVK